MRYCRRLPNCCRLSPSHRHGRRCPPKTRPFLRPSSLVTSRMLVMKMNDPRQAPLDAVLRKHFLSFSQKVFQEVGSGTFDPNWHHEAIAHRLDQCASGKTKRLIINIQPRSLKSILVSVAWP